LRGVCIHSTINNHPPPHQYPLAKNPKISLQPPLYPSTRYRIVLLSQNTGLAGTKKQRARGKREKNKGGQAGSPEGGEGWVRGREAEGTRSCQKKPRWGLVWRGHRAPVRKKKPPVRKAGG